MLQAGGEGWFYALRYDRAVLSTEGYRLLTAHWMHVDWGHAVMNVAGLVLLALVERSHAGLRLMFLRCLLLCLAVGLSLHFLHPELRWYVGFSGVLHGLFVMAMLGILRESRDPLAGIVLLVLLGKLAWEHYHGPLTSSMIAAPVIVEAHAYGALSGLFLSAAALLAQWFERRGRQQHGQ